MGGKGKDEGNGKGGSRCCAMLLHGREGRREKRSQQNLHIKRKKCDHLLPHYAVNCCLNQEKLQ